jgi:O-antigen/teichoic acid export membrane protein
MAAGFISFPILTRIFSVSDYGMLNLINTTVFIVIAILKFGFPSAIVQFYAQFHAGKRSDNFFLTIFLSSIGIAAAGVILFIFVLQVFRNKFQFIDSTSIIYIISILIFISCVIDSLTSFLRAEQKTRFYNLLAVLRRYGALALGIFLSVYLVKGINGFFVGHIVAGGITLLLLMYSYRSSIKVSVKGFSPDILKSSILFGLPLIWAELGHLILNFADRYLIQMYLGSTPLGIYTAGYNLATHVSEAIIYPVNYAMTPIYMSILVHKGVEETQLFFVKLFRYFLLVMIPAVFGIIAIGKNLIAFLASAKYLESYSILSYVIIGQSVYACSLILNTGLFINKKTSIVAKVILIACVVNIGLNLVLIPKLGIVGAGQATLYSNIFYTVVIVYYSFKEFRFRIDYPKIILYLCASAVMFLIIRGIDLGGHGITLISQILVGIIVYASLITVLDKDIKRNLLNFARGLKV